MTSLVVLYVYLSNSTAFTNRAIQIIMKSMGHNVILLPREANPLDTYRCTEAQVLFPDATTRTLAAHAELQSTYYVSVLQRIHAVKGLDVVLTGIEPVRRPDETPEKANPVTPIEAGRARIGSEVSRRLGIKKGDEVALRDRPFHVEDVLPPKGSIDDHRIYIGLADCQALLDAPGRINAILAFECLHGGGTLNEIAARQQSNLARVLPGMTQITKTDIAQGRYLTRLTTSRYLHYLFGLVLVITIVVIAVAGLQDVSERRKETGILISMGTGYLYLVGLHVVKMLCVALAASIAGFVIGAFLSVWLTGSFLAYQTQPVSVIWRQMPGVMLMACAVAATAEILPMIKLVRMDPCDVLMEE
jgi:ABC-type lipoprotein release transport system permease subunit